MKNVVIWGCGEQGRALAGMFDYREVVLLGFVDRRKEGNIVVNEKQIAIIGVEDLKDIDYDYLFVSSRLYESEILEEIENRGILDGRVVPYSLSLAKLGEIMNLFSERGWQYMNTLYQSVQMWRMNEKANKIIYKENSMLEIQKTTINNQKKIIENQKGILEENRRIYQSQEFIKKYMEHVCKTEKEDNSIRIGLITLSRDTNIPERVIANSTRYLIQNALRELAVKDYIFIEIYMREIELNKLVNCDMIFFVGGGIIKYNNYWSDFPGQIDKITLLAEKYNIPIMFVGVGVESYDENDEKCKQLQMAINRECVKIFTARDNEENCKKYIRNKSIITKMVADPALHTKDSYVIHTHKRKKVIGIGTINYDNWELEHHNIDKNVLSELYQAIFYELEKRGYTWELFTDGVYQDYTFALELVGENEEYSKRLIPRPFSDVEWLDTISGFAGIIVPRLHANIVAHSLGIPAVGLIWNDKVRFFAEQIKQGDTVFETFDFDAVKIVDKLEELIENEQKVNYLEEYKKTTYDAVKEFVKDILVDL